MAKIGRNAPCPCGSGKKYKKCCLRKHEEETRKALKAASEEYTSAESENELDTKVGDLRKDHEDSNGTSSSDENYENFFKNYRAADFAGKVAIIEDAFTDNDLMSDGEAVFELFNDLSTAASDIEERKVHYDLVLRLRDHLPEVYDNEAGYLLDGCVANALIDNRIPTLEQSFKELARLAHKEIDIFFSRLDHVAYYGHLDLLVEAMRVGWEDVKDSSGILQWGMDEYADKAGDFELFYYLSNASGPRSDDEVLIEKLVNYYELDPEGLKRYFACITRTCDHVWSLDDFDYQIGKKSNRGVSKTVLMDNISCLINEFLGYLHSDENVSYPKAEIIRTEMNTYLKSRIEGELEMRQSPFEAQKKPKKRKVQTSSHAHILCPDRPTFERFLVRKMNIINPQHYRALACFESVPAWLRFLESNRLINFALRKETFLSISQLYSAMEAIAKKDEQPEDLLLTELKNAWNDPDVRFQD